MIAIAVINRKGGSSKSSVSIHLGGTLAASGRRTLLVDVDPQSSLTQVLLGARALTSLSPSETIASIWDSDPLVERLVHGTQVHGLSLIPGHESADRWNHPVGDDHESLSRIRDVLREARDDFDVAILDCAPNLYRCSTAAMVAATHVIVPSQPEDFGSQGIVVVNRAIRSIQAEYGNPEILGYLLVQVDRRLGVHQAYSEALRETFKGLVFETVMPRSAVYAEAISARLPVSHYKPRSAAAKMFQALAAEIDRRLEAADGEVNAA